MSSPDQPVPESEPDGAEVPQPPAAADDPDDAPTSDTEGTGIDSEIAQQQPAPEPGGGESESAAPAGDGDTAATPDQPAATESAEAEVDIPVAEPAHDELRTPVLEALTEKLGDGLVASELAAGRDLWVRVSRESWVEAGRVCRDELGMSYFCYLSAVDWLPSPFGKSEDDSAPTPVDPSAPLEHGVTGGDTRFQVIARLERPGTAVGLNLKVDVPDDDLSLPTWVDLYAGAQWHERETWEMYGIDFPGNPLKNEHLYLPGAFEGHPLRKDFPLLARMVKPWPGLVDVEPMPGEPEGDEESEEASA